MTRVIVAEPARRDLADLTSSRRLPPTARDRVRRSLEPLARFRLLGPALEGRWHGFRSMFGPWPWMLIVYTVDDEQDLVIVVTIQDTHAGMAARSQR